MTGDTLFFLQLRVTCSAGNLSGSMVSITSYIIYRLGFFKFILLEWVFLNLYLYVYSKKDLIKYMLKGHCMDFFFWGGGVTTPFGVKRHIMIWFLINRKAYHGRAHVCTTISINWANDFDFYCYAFADCSCWVWCK